MKAEILPLSSIQPDSRNANKGTERGRYALERSLEKLGAGRSILLDKNGKIIAGNKTAETAGEMGIEDVVIVRTKGDKLVAVMREDGFRVTFSGEGSDELWASYGFAYHALQKQDWHSYRRDLFLSQSYKNFIRCNKIFMAHSIECRLPFLHYPLVEFALSLPRAIVQNGRSKPKAIIQDAFRGLLPAPIVDRPKVAFQDGMGLKRAIETVLPSPERFYHAEYRARFA